MLFVIIVVGKKFSTVVFSIFLVHRNIALIGRRVIYFLLILYIIQVTRVFFRCYRNMFDIFVSDVV